MKSENIANDLTIFSFLKTSNIKDVEINNGIEYTANIRLSPQCRYFSDVECFEILEELIA